jgi:glutaminase
MQTACCRRRLSAATPTAVKSILRFRQNHPHNTKTSHNKSQKKKINRLILLRGMYRGVVRNLRERDYLGDSGVDGRIILRWIFRKWGVRVWNGLSWLRIGTGVGNL